MCTRDRYCTLVWKTRRRTICLSGIMLIPLGFTGIWLDMGFLVKVAYGKGFIHLLSFVSVLWGLKGKSLVQYAIYSFICLMICPFLFVELSIMHYTTEVFFENLHMETLAKMLCTILYLTGFNFFLNSGINATLIYYEIEEDDGFENL